MSRRTSRRQPNQTESPFIRLNVLSKPSSQIHRCELCERVATLQCSSCKATYYCDQEHFWQDRELHMDICQRIKDLRKPMEFSPVPETRDRWIKQHKIRLHEIYDYTCKKGEAAMEEGKYDAAIPAAIVSIKYAQELYGQAPEVIPPLLVVTECYVNKGRLNTADGYLARVLSIEVSGHEVSPSIRARIRRNEGLIHVAKNELQDAIECFAEEIYQNTKEFGPTHIRTSGGYCYLGYVFFLRQEYIACASLFRQTVDIWVTTVHPILEEMTSQPDMPTLGIKQTDVVWMEECDQFNGLRILTKCHSHQTDTPSQANTVTTLDLARSCYAIGTLLYMCDRYHESKAKAVQGIQRSDKHKTADPQMTTIRTYLYNLIKYNDRKLFKMRKQHSVAGSSHQTGKDEVKRLDANKDTPPLPLSPRKEDEVIQNDEAPQE